MRLKPTLFAESNAASEDVIADCYVLGGGRVAAFVARRLRSEGRTVSVVDEAHDPSEAPGVRGDPTDVATLNEAGVSEASTVIVATPSDNRNLLVAQLVRAYFDVPELLVLVNAPDRCDVLAAAGHRPVCATTALSEALVDAT